MSLHVFTPLCANNYETSLQELLMVNEHGSTLVLILLLPAVIIPRKSHQAARSLGLIFLIWKVRPVRQWDK